MHGSIGKNARPSDPLNEEHAKVECAGKPTGIAIGMHGSIGKNTRLTGSLNNTNTYTVVEYAGMHTDTAVVTIDNAKRTISVDVSKLPHGIAIEDRSGGEASTSVFDGSSDKRLVLSGWTVRSVEPKSESSEAEYSLERDGAEVGDRIIIPKDQALIGASLIYANAGNLSEIQNQCPEAKENDPCLDFVVSNQVDGNGDRHYYVLLASLSDSVAEIGSKVDSEANRAQAAEKRLAEEAAASKEELHGNINAVNSDLQDKFKQGVAGVEAEIQRATEAEEQLSSYILEEKNARESADSELQTNINNKVGKNFTIAGMTLEDNISKEELLKSLGFEFADI